MSSYKDLEVWNVSMNFVESIYDVTRNFPKEEIYGLTSQIRRAAVSIPTNLAEGAARKTQKDFAHFVSIAYGSCCELETLIAVSKRIKILNDADSETFNTALASISRMLKALRKSLSV
jgi:four helix bundle protein